MREREEKKSGLCTAGLVVGIVGICTSFIPVVNNMSFILGILAIIFGLCSIKKAGKVKLILTVILGILSVYLTVQAQKDLSDSLNDVFGGNTEKILAECLDVEIGNFEVSGDEFFTNTKLNVKVTNKTNEKKSYSIKIEAVTEDGTRIEESTVYANDLNAGQSQNLEAFTLSSGKAEQLKSATFKVIEASMY